MKAVYRDGVIFTYSSIILTSLLSSIQAWSFLFYSLFEYFISVLRISLVYHAFELLANHSYNLLL